MVADKKRTNLELFAGGGGLALGLKQAGFSQIGLIENDEMCVKTLKQNGFNCPIIDKDITKLHKDSLEVQYLKKYIGNLDLLSGGFPCQSFSYAGKGLGFADTRGTLFHNYAYFLNWLQPKMFLAENVPGLLTNDQGKTFKVIQNTFEKCGYKIQFKILNSNDYGVAEKRRRLIIVGVRKDLNLTFKYPTKQDYKPILKDVLKNVPSSPGSKYSQTRYNILKQVPAGGNWRDLPIKIAKAYMKNDYSESGGSAGVAKRLSWNKPAPTILTSAIGKRTERCHPDKTRPLTVRENARIQGFPDDYIFAGAMTRQYRQIGNAVPVPLAKWLGESILKTLKKA